MNFYTFLLQGRMFKVFAIMKLTFLLVVLLSFNVSASVFAQQITLNEKNAPLGSIFKKIEKQSGYTFVYENDLLKQAKTVTINIKNADLTSALDRCLEGQPLTYSVVEKTVILKSKEKNLIQKVKKLFKPSIKVTGKVTDTTGHGLPGASVRIKGKMIVYITQVDGQFNIEADPGDLVSVSFVGYAPYTFTVIDNMSFQNIVLYPASSALHEIIVSTGYQTLPKERATGSFVQLDSTLINRRVGTNILDRLEGVTSGLLFNSRILDGSNNAAVTIRGRSTIFANPNPLIVVDNFPYDGDLNNINPNDVDNITVLKDAAAASIWGVRAGNGVIVVTTKKGKRNAGPSVSLNSNITIGQKPDLYYPAQMSSTDFIGLEKYLFDQGYFDYTISNGYSAITPAVALMDKLKNGAIAQSNYGSQIEGLKQQDVRNDLTKYFYRKSVSQQYNIGISGGGERNKYYISGGYDKNLGNFISNSYNRYTVTANNTLDFFKDKLEIFTSFNISKSNTYSGSNAYSPIYTPYDQLADKNGNALPVVDLNNQQLRASYVDTAGNGKLLDWRYYPLNERSSNVNTGLTNYRLLSGLSYKFTSHFKLQLNYQYEQEDKDNAITHNINSFYVRDLVNRFSSIDASGTVNRVIPLGEINDLSSINSHSQYGRAQLAYDNTFGKNHALAIIAGFEVKDYRDNYFGQRLYGYDPSTGTNANASINPMAYYSTFYDPYTTQTLSTDPSLLGNIDRYRSWYANASYSYDNKYTLTASVRKDETNIFGVSANQKGVPLWSAGLSWQLSREKFYHFDVVPYLKLRATYGYNGNTDKSTSAYLTAAAMYYNLWNVNYATVINPPNPALGWEKIQNINIGMDFALKGNFISGTIEYYQKHGEDLIGNSPIAPQTGVSLFKGNTANTQTNGVDITLNFSILKSNVFHWDINAIYSYNLDKVTKYKATQGLNGYIVFNNYENPLQGYPYYALFAFKSGGLDANGNPQGYLNGAVSTDYDGIYNSPNANELMYVGSATPTSYGSLRNTFSYQQWSLSANVTYKFGYYFRRSDAFDGSNYSYKQSDYDKRWQKAGDELTTTVPSLIYPDPGTRGVFYMGTSSLIEKGDHIRLQDIRLSYMLKKENLKGLPFSSLQIYSYLNNVGILWRANKRGIDPDAGTQLIPTPRTLAIGLNANF